LPRITALAWARSKWSQFAFLHQLKTFRALGSPTVALFQMSLSKAVADCEVSTALHLSIVLV
jgi:hypothetical protein